MKEIEWKKHSRTFDPMKYPLTNLVEATPAK